MFSYFQNIRYVAKEEMDLFLQEQKIQDTSFGGITPWFNLIASSMLPIWWENIDNLESFQDHTSITRFESRNEPTI